MEGACQASQSQIKAHSGQQHSYGVFMKNLKRVCVYSLLILLLGFVYQPAFAANKVNINTATVAQLVEIKGIGEKTAQKIIEYRKKNKFKTVDELVNVKGIGEKTLEKIRDQVTVKAKKKKKSKKKNKKK